MSLFLFLLLFFPFLNAVADQEISTEQCRAASAGIIEISEKALEVTESKKNVKKLTRLVSEWKKRLNSEEDACDVYQSILKASTRF